jgi:hypothetical protein
VREAGDKDKSRPREGDGSWPGEATRLDDAAKSAHTPSQAQNQSGKWTLTRPDTPLTLRTFGAETQSKTLRRAVAIRNASRCKARPQSLGSGDARTHTHTHTHTHTASRCGTRGRVGRSCLPAHYTWCGCEPLLSTVHAGHGADALQQRPRARALPSAAQAGYGGDKGAVCRKVNGAVWARHVLGARRHQHARSLSYRMSEPSRMSKGGWAMISPTNTPHDRGSCHRNGEHAPHRHTHAHVHTQRRAG